MKIVAVLILILIWCVVVPYLLGQLVRILIKEEEHGNIVYGFMTMCVSFLILATPMIIMKLPFHVLLYSWTGLILLLCAAAVIMNRRAGNAEGHEVTGLKQEINSVREFLGRIAADRFIMCIWLAAAAVILFEAALPAVTMHIDTDDARFIAEANEAIEYDTMLVRHAIINKYIGFVPGEQIKEVTAPYPLFIALLSRLCGVGKPAIMAHTVLPPLLILLSYLVYGLIGAYIFAGDIKKRGLFLLFLSLIHLFSFETIYASGYTLLTIIWQGRSISAMIMLPFMWYLLMKTTDKERLRAADYLTVTAAGLANAMLSNMGAIVAVVILAAYAVVNGVRLRSFKTLVIMGVCAVPEAALVGVTRFLRGIMERM